MAKKEDGTAAPAAATPLKAESPPKGLARARRVYYVDKTGARSLAIILKVDKKANLVDLEVLPPGGVSYLAKDVAFNAARTEGTFHDIE